MSNALAIATVTETLRNMLQNVLDPTAAGAVSPALISGAQVSTLRPDDPSLPPTGAGVNIFLYQVTPNTAWRNADLPTRGPDGAPLQRPQAALDLHYLISFYGADATLEQQRLLGAVARVLHATPFLDRATLLSTQAQVDPSSGKQFFNSNLSGQTGLVRFTQINFSLEEMSKLWSVFLKTDYVLSLAYTASVVLIETDDPPPGDALPVRRRHVRAAPFSLAEIDAVSPQAVALSTPGPTVITLQGQGLGTDSIVAFTTPGEAAPILGTINAGSTSESMTVSLPAGLHPGVNTVQLTQPAPPASPPGGSPHILSQSNAAAFVILPVIGNVNPSSPPGELIVSVSPSVMPEQQVYLMLNQLAGSPPAGPQAFALPADPHPNATGTLSFSTTFAGGSVPAGSYLARVRVDSAESRLKVDASGAFSGPLVDLP